MSKNTDLDLSNLNTANIITASQRAFSKALRYRVMVFIALLVAVYGFLIFQIRSLGAVQPAQQNSNSKLQANSTPVINQDAVKQLEKLKDNSVNVKALFEKARKNPFNE